MSKPRILLICDVRGWAWDIKCQQIVKYLSDEFDFVIVYRFQEGKIDIKQLGDFDIYFTFAPRFLGMLEKVPIHKRVSGITAHFLGMDEEMNKHRQQVKWFHANSQLLVRAAQRYYPNTFYVPNGVDETLYKRDLNHKRVFGDYFTIGHVGKNTPRKGYWDIIHPAFCDAYRTGPMRIVANLRRYKNALPQHKMVEWYQEIDIMVFASKLDGTPNPMLEAAACGIPSIINPIGNAPEFITKTNGVLIHEVGVTNYCRLMEWARDNPDKVKEMGKKARETVLAGWTWKGQSAYYRNMFRTILCVNG